MVAASGLLAIRGKLNDQQWAALLPTIRKAGLAESNPVVLSSLFQLLSVEQGPRVESALPVVQEILDARLDSFEQKQVLPTLADAEAAAWLGARLVALNPQLVSAGARQIARLLADALETYLSLSQKPSQAAKPAEPKKPGEPKKPAEPKKPSEPKKAEPKGPTGDQKEELERLERIIRSAESSLKALVKGANQPDVTGAMLGGGADRADKMRLALNAWIGTTQSPGVLNGPPYNFPSGLGIKRASATSPTTQ
jgi:hypothetical protein